MLLPVAAIVKRDLRKYFRSAAILTISLFFPLLQLVVIGYAFGGQIKNVSVALVSLDRGADARRLEERFQAVEANAQTFHVQRFASMDAAVQATRNGLVSATIVIPEEYSRRVNQRNAPDLALILDNTDPFVGATLAQKLRELLLAVNQADVTPRQLGQVALEVVEIYPYVEYIQYLLPGSVLLAIFVCAGIGGGLTFIDDKARGFHEGYLVTPVTKTQLVTGMVLAGTLKATVAGVVVTFVGAAIARVPLPLSPVMAASVIGFNVLVALALVTMISLFLVRVSDPAIPRAAYGIVNTLLFFPSGAMYPVSSFPQWMQWLAAANPFSYGVHGLRTLLLKGVGGPAIANDVAFLACFSLACFVGVLWLFPRRL
jgi:ABC-2 type transport system permease protein